MKKMYENDVTIDVRRAFFIALSGKFLLFINFVYKIPKVNFWLDIFFHFTFCLDKKRNLNISTCLKMNWNISLFNLGWSSICYNFLSYSMINNHEQITSSENYKLYLNLCFKCRLVKLILVHIWQIDTIIAVLVLHIPCALKSKFFTLLVNCDNYLKMRNQYKF